MEVEVEALVRLAFGFMSMSMLNFKCKRKVFYLINEMPEQRTKDEIISTLIKIKFMTKTFFRRFHE